MFFIILRIIFLHILKLYYISFFIINFVYAFSSLFFGSILLIQAFDFILLYTDVNSVFLLFIQQIYVRHLLGSRHYSSYWRYGGEQNRNASFLDRTYFLVGED